MPGASQSLGFCLLKIQKLQTKTPSTSPKSCVYSFVSCICVCVCVCVPFVWLKIIFVWGGWLGVIAPRNATFCLTHSDKIALVKNGADGWFHPWRDTYHIQIDRQFKICRYAMYDKCIYIYIHNISSKVQLCMYTYIYYILYRCM